MVQRLAPAIARLRSVPRAGSPFGGIVHRHVAVLRLVLALHQRPGELELRLARLRHVGAVVRQVGRARVLGHLPVRQLAVGQAVLADVGRICLPLHGDRREPREAIGPAERGGRVVDELLLGRRARARTRDGQNGNESRSERQRVATWRLL
jgi:hypothetical protein